MKILKNIVVINIYFKLNPECYLIRGKKNGVILDLISLKVYILDHEETTILTSAEKNNIVPENSEFLINLKELCLGNFYSNRTYIDKLRVGSLSNVDNPNPLNLNRAFLEINNTCNKNCSYCSYYGIKRTLGCMGCNKWNDSDVPVTLERWKSLIDELIDLECNDIIIMGGDLTLEWEKTLEILEYANGKFNSTQITIHQQNLSENIINDINGMANLIIQTEDPNDIKPGDFVYLLVLEPENRHYFNKIKDYENVLIDFVIDNKENLVDLPIMLKDRVFPVDVYQFFHNLECHPCIGNIITISNSGDVFTCPTIRDYKFGNIKNKKLYMVFNKKMDEINELWKLNLDKVKKCTDCEFRYICIDCRSLEKSLTGKLKEKILCNYNPEEDEWL